VFLFLSLVNAILWIENHVFLTVYANSKNEEHTHTAYMVDRRQPEDKRYVLLDEINPIFDIDAPNSYFYMSTLHNMGPDIKTLIVIANAGTNELAVVGQGDDGAWATWMLDEASMPRLPLSEDDVSDTYPVGLAFDLSATEPLDPYDAAESETPVPAMPVLYFLTNEGSICAYHAYNDELAKLGGCYADMVEAQSVDQIPAPSAPSSVPFSELKTSSSAPTSSEHKSSFGNIATKIPSFTSMTTSKSATTQPTTSLPFASLSSEGPKFGTTSSIGLGVGASSPSQKQGVPFSSLSRSSSSETKLPTALVSSSSSSAPAFGSTTSFGAGNGTPTFGSTTAFGAGGFGSAGTFKTAAPSFGGFKNAMSSPQKPFGDVSFKTGSDTTPSKFAPSILDANEDEEKKTSSEEKEKSIETEKSTSEFAPSTLDANDEEKKKKSTTEEKSTSKFAPSTLDAKDDEKTTESKKNSPTFAPSILDDTDNEKKQAAEDGAPSTLKANKESETEMKASNDQVEDLKEVTGDAQLTDNENTDDNVPSKKSTPVEPTSCSLSFEELQKTLEEDDTGSDISKISSIHDSGDDNSENDSYSRNESSDDKEEAKKEEKQDLEEEKKILAEEKRIKDEKRLAEEKRIEEEKRIAQEKRLVEEKRKVAERIAEEKRKDAERVAEEKQLEAEKIAEEKRLEAEIAEKERVEAERIAEERLQAERLAAIKPDPLFAVREPEQYETTNYKRTPVILPMAKDFEELYFSTLEEMESVSISCLILL
jgi:hypothetical protein